MSPLPVVPPNEAPTCAHPIRLRALGGGKRTDKERLSPLEEEDDDEKDSGTRWRVTRRTVDPFAPPAEPFDEFTVLRGTQGPTYRLPDAPERNPARRKRAVKARTIRSDQVFHPAELPGQASSTDDAEAFVRLPQTRADCAQIARPCPFVSCRYHLYLDVSPKTGSLKLNFPDLEVWELPESCALDVADKGGITTDELGELMNITRERARQIEGHALSKASNLLSDDR